MPEEASMREAYGQTLVELGKTNPDVVVLDADLCASTMTKYFMQEFPERSFDAPENPGENPVVSVEVGLALDQAGAPQVVEAEQAGAVQPFFQRAQESLPLLDGDRHAFFAKAIKEVEEHRLATPLNS